MPHFKTESFSVHNGVAAHKLKIKVSIDACGHFYAYLPAEYYESVKGVLGHTGNPVDQARGVKITEVTYEAFRELVISVLKAYSMPLYEEYPVIRFKLETHVAFAEDDGGNVYPNGYFEGARWTDDDGRYGKHHASKPCKGGYSLTIGARAMMKKVTRYGSSEKIEYQPYYKGASHLGVDNPAQLLNGWCGVYLGDDAREIPYSDEAALFFHSLMQGMAMLAKKIQDHTFDPEDLAALISKGGFTLLPAPMQSTPEPIQ